MSGYHSLQCHLLPVAGIKLKWARTKHTYKKLHLLGYKQDRYKGMTGDESGEFVAFIFSSQIFTMVDDH